MSLFVIRQMETAQPARMCGSMIVTGETTRTGNGTFETFFTLAIILLKENKRKVHLKHTHGNLFTYFKYIGRVTNKYRI